MIMKRIAFVDQNPVAGGIIRFGTNLAAALTRVHPGLEITFFTTQINYKQNAGLFDNYNGLFKTRILKSTRKTYTGTMFLDTALLRVLGTSRSELLKKEIYWLTKDFDAVYFTNVHASEFIKVKPPSFATFHDLLWKYRFGMPLFSSENVSILDSHIRMWLKQTRIIVSTPFVRSEILRFFPETKQDIDVVYLPNLAQQPKQSRKDDAATMRSLGITNEYILYPSHLMPHKNHQNLFCAFSKLMESEEFSGKYILVLTGGDTDHIKHGLAIPIGLKSSGEKDFNILGLGYISNNAVDILIRNASLVISTSLYEAGSGPATDAWLNGVPVIISNIQSHLDQIDFFGIECRLFDPTNPDDIHQKLAYALRNLHELRAESQRASEKLAEYTWKDVGSHYLDIIKNKRIR
jgi:glycosyltransferase involved in cell wall biosynthesis